MSYSLRPVKRGVEEFDFGAFSWPVLLEACGYLFPCIHAQGKYCSPDRDSMMIGTNDGYLIKAADAKLMARCARNFVAIQRGLAADHTGWPDAIRTDFVERFEKFAAWAERSGGFRIH